MPIILREHVFADLEACCAWQCDPIVATYVLWLPRTRAECEASLRDAIAQQSARPRTRYFYAIADSDTGEMLGDIGFTILTDGIADCGWFLCRQYWRKGYATTAIRLMIQYAAAIPEIRMLTASCHRDNQASQRLMVKCGFRPSRESVNRLYFELPNM